MTEPIVRYEFQCLQCGATGTTTENHWEHTCPLPGKGPEPPLVYIASVQFQPDRQGIHIHHRAT
jgi:hypothetical protein